MGNGNKLVGTLAAISTTLAILTVVYANARDPYRLTQVEKTTDELNRRVHQLEVNYAVIVQRLDAIKELLNAVSNKIDSYEKGRMDKGGAWLDNR